MGLTTPVRRLSEAEYLEIERGAEFKSQFFDGGMFAMASGTQRHSLISANCGREFGIVLRGSRCVVFDSNIKVKSEVTGLYTYADVTIACGEQRFFDEEMDVLLNPSLVIEVLSDSTEAFERGKKAEHYRQIASLGAYLLISQDRPHVEQYIRQPSGDWLLRETTGVEAKLEVATLGVAIPMSEIYAGVKFPPTAIEQPDGR
jgi:Uma2 family endonuclease